MNQIGDIQRDLRLALVEQLCQAFSSEADDEGTTENGDGSFSFWVQGTDRDYHANSVLQLIAITGDKVPPRCDDDDAPWIEHESTHLQVSDDGPEYVSIYSLRQHGATLSISALLGDYTDDDHDLYLSGCLRFASEGQPLVELVRGEQRRCFDQMLGYVGHMLASELSTAPDGLLDAADPLLLGKLEGIITTCMGRGAAT